MNTQTVTTTEVKSYDSRNHSRFRFRLQADAHIEGQGVFRGFVKDISLQGVTLYLDRNLLKDKSVQIRIHVPPAATTEKAYSVVATGKTIHSIFDSDELNFRLGIKLLYFASEADETYLKKYLKIR